MNCPFCGSVKIVKCGKAYIKKGEVQNYLCKKCNKRTIHPKR
jgi:transposase-like protein